MSFDDAMFILNGTVGPVFPNKFENVRQKNDYKVGPGYEDQSYLSIDLNAFIQQRKVSNVIGVIQGCVEPDRFVIVGNASPVRGATTLVLLSEMFTETMKSEKWCPRRSIVFCDWGPAQDLTIGMTEWVGIPFHISSGLIVFGSD